MTLIGTVIPYLLICSRALEGSNMELHSLDEVFYYYRYYEDELSRKDWVA